MGIGTGAKSILKSQPTQAMEDTAPMDLTRNQGAQEEMDNSEEVDLEADTERIDKLGEDAGGPRPSRT